MTREEAIEFIAQSVKDDVDMAKVADAIKALELIPDNATNGEVIQALFPNEKWERCPENRYNRASMQSDNMGINMELWNAPYKNESDKSADTFEKLLDSGFYEGFRKGDKG